MGLQRRIEKKALPSWFGASALTAMLLGWLLRLWFVFRESQITGDSLIYGEIARNVIQHHVYGFSATLNGVALAPHPTLIRLPGYSFFLGVCFLVFGMERYTAVLLMQTMVDLWTCLLLAGLAGRIFGRRAAVAALWLGTLCPFMANYVAAPLTETLTLFCIALAFYGLMRWRQAGAEWNRWLYVIALALTYAILLRPEQGMLAACVLPTMLWLGRSGVTWRLRPVVAVAVLTLLPLVPWTVRNWVTFGVFQPLAPRYANDPGEFNPAGFERWYRTWAIDFASTENIYWNYDGGPMLIGDLPNRAFDSQTQYGETASLLSDFANSPTITPAMDARFDAIARERIRADGLRYYLGLPVARVVDMTLRPRVDALAVPLEWWKWRGHVRASVFALAYAALNLFYLVIGVIGFLRHRRMGAWEAIVWAMAGTIVVRCLLLLTLDNSEPRYTLEFYPVLIVLGAACLADFRHTAESTMRR